MTKNDIILSVEDLYVDFHLPNHTINALKGVSFGIKKGETVALVGQSGAGKSITVMSVLQLLPYPMAKHPKGKICFNNENIIAYTKKQLQDVRGNGIAIIFQEPMTSLNPLQTVCRKYFPAQTKDD